MSTEKTIKWKRPSGNELITDDSKATVEYLESLGFEQIKGGDKDSATILVTAKACYDANRKYCKSIDDYSVPAWTKAEEWQRESAINGVKHLIENPAAKPEESHGFVPYSGVDEGGFVPYSELSEEQKRKVEIFLETAKEALKIK